jgi:hypothetical protein
MLYGNILFVYRFDYYNNDTTLCIRVRLITSAIIITTINSTNLFTLAYRDYTPITPSNDVIIMGQSCVISWQPSSMISPSSSSMRYSLALFRGSQLLQWFLHGTHTHTH